jgi:hypothetical protein
MDGALAAVVDTSSRKLLEMMITLGTPTVEYVHKPTAAAQFAADAMTEML